MTTIADIYNEHYLAGYRDKLSGYEFARWHALDHLISKILRLNKVKKVLDYGSGSGLHVDLWKKLFPVSDLYFCDISQVALEKLAQKYPEFETRIGIVCDYKAKFPDSFFDVIVSVEVMEHVDDLNGYLGDVCRLLKPEGLFIWTTPCANHFSIEHVYSALTFKIEKTSEKYRRWKWEDPKHIRRLKSQEIKGILRTMGFDDVKFKFRSHFFSFMCTLLCKGVLRKLGERLMLLDYILFRNLPNGASMLGYAKKNKCDSTR